MEIKSFFTLLVAFSLMHFFFLLGLAVIYGGLKHWFNCVFCFTHYSVIKGRRM
jgi:hypothetical protein